MADQTQQADPWAAYPAIQGPAPTTDQSNTAQAIPTDPWAAYPAVKTPQPVQAPNPNANDMPGEGVFRKVGQAGRILEGAIPETITGVADLGTTGMNYGIDAANDTYGMRIPKGVMLTPYVEKGLDTMGFPKLDDDLPTKAAQLTAGAMTGGESTVPLLKQAGTELAGMGGKAIDAAKELPGQIGDLASQTKDLFTAPKNEITNPLKAQAGKFYKQAGTQGGAVHQQVTNDWLDTLDNFRPGKTLSSEPSDVEKYINTAQSKLKDQSMSLQDIIDYDKELGSKITDNFKNGRPTADAQKFIGMQDSLRNSVLDAPKELILHPQGFDAWQSAMRNWSQGRKLDDISRIADRASMSPTPATSIQSSARTMYANPARTRGWSDDEKAMLQKAGQTGALTELGKLAGNRLGPMLSGALELHSGVGPGLTTALIHSQVNKLGNNFAGNLQMNKLNQLADFLKSNAKAKP